MTDKQWIKTLQNMGFKELFAEVMDRPELLTDGYYRNLGEAIRARYAELLKEQRGNSPE